MTESRNQMDRALKDIVVPELRANGFKGSLPHFRRIADAHVHLMTFQFDRHGGGFVIEVAVAPNKPFTTHWGEVIPQNKLTAHDLTERLRLHPKGILKDSSTDDWFRYDQPSLLGNRQQKVARQVLKVLPLAEDYWRKT